MVASAGHHVEEAPETVGAASAGDVAEADMTSQDFVQLSFNDQHEPGGVYWQKVRELYTAGQQPPTASAPSHGPAQPPPTAPAPSPVSLAEWCNIVKAIGGLTGGWEGDWDEATRKVTQFRSAQEKVKDNGHKKRIQKGQRPRCPSGLWAIREQPTTGDYQEKVGHSETYDEWEHPCFLGADHRRLPFLIHNATATPSDANPVVPAPTRHQHDPGQYATDGCCFAMLRNIWQLIVMYGS